MYTEYYLVPTMHVKSKSRNDGDCLKGVMTQSMVDALFGVLFPIQKGGNSAFIAAIASGLLQTEYNLPK